MLDNLIYLAIVVCLAGLLFCVAGIVYQVVLKARYEREIRERMLRLAAERRIASITASQHLADVRAANCDRCDGLAKCETCRWAQ